MNSDLDALKQTVAQAFSLAHRAEVSQPIDLARLGAFLREVDEDFSPQKYGAEKLRPCLEQIPAAVQLIKDDSIEPPRYFASYIGRPEDPYPESVSQEGQISIKPPPRPITTLPRSTRQELGKLDDFAYIHNDKWTQLAALARKETWGDPKTAPLLSNYVRHTFSRLVYEEKIMFSKSGENVAFNTGLVDRRFQSIYILLKKNGVAGAQAWRLDGFCIAGENYNGKSLVRNFKPLPEAADYFTNPSDIFFDIKADIHSDWEHVIEEHVERIPLELLGRTTQNFEIKSCNSMTEDEVYEYGKQFSDYLQGDEFAHRSLIDAFERAKQLALKKVRWNYKTAIPVYDPARNKLNMLLPLCMVSEDRVDLALLVERTESGNYLGHTIYPLEWAYKHARLVARPESEWLREETGTAE